MDRKRASKWRPLSFCRNAAIWCVYCQLISAFDGRGSSQAGQPVPACDLHPRERADRAAVGGQPRYIFISRRCTGNCAVCHVCSKFPLSLVAAFTVFLYPVAVTVIALKSGAPHPLRSAIKGQGHARGDHDYSGAGCACRFRPGRRDGRDSRI